MTYPEALERLFGLQRFGLRLGLEVPRELANRAGVSPAGLRFIHVAGTNGKGSACAFLESMERAAGRRVGLYTSPHLVSFRERIQLDRVPISEADVARWVERLGTAAEGLEGDRHPTFFEWVTVLALGWFQEQGCDLVVWETGLGGRLDATNIVTPMVSVITNIGWDHMQWLGSTLPEIAREKAGIIKRGRPVFTATTDPEACRVIEATASENHAPYRRVSATDPEADFVRAVGPSLEGDHQVLNAALAVAVVRAMEKEFPVNEVEQARGLATAKWPGRFQRIQDGGREWILDGAHNRPAFEALARTLSERFPGAKFDFLLGLLGDKDAPAAVEFLAPLARSVVVVPVQSNRAGDPSVLAGLFRASGIAAPVIARDWRDAFRLARGPGPLVVTGSLYLVGEALEFFESNQDDPTRRDGPPAVASRVAAPERALNDWSPKSVTG